MVARPPEEPPPQAASHSAAATHPPMTTDLRILRSLTSPSMWHVKQLARDDGAARREQPRGGARGGEQRPALRELGRHRALDELVVGTTFVNHAEFWAGSTTT